MKKIINNIMNHASLVNQPPVLVDIGASGFLHRKWRSIAKYSVCIAFDADTRDFDASEIENKIAKLSGYLELKEASFNSFVDWVLDLREKIKIPHKLSDCAKITDKDIEKLSPMALNDPCTPENPKKTSLDDMKLMYKHSLEGKLF